MEAVQPFLPYIVLITYFLASGIIMEAIDRHLGQPKAGAKGGRGVWFCWKRVFLLVFGALLGLGGWALGVPALEQLGQGAGGGVMSGLLGAMTASLFYDLAIGTVRAWLKHRAEKE